MSTVLQNSRGSATQQLTDLVDARNKYDIPHQQLLPLQLVAADELLQERKGQIRLLCNRAETGGIDSVRRTGDLIPLLFAHTAYKSYPESWLSGQNWERLSKWLETVSTTRVEGVDLKGIRDIDDWLSRLEQRGHFVSCSSGTSGKSAMLNATAEDLEIGKHEVVASIAWATGVEPLHDRKMFGLAPVASVPRNHAVRAGMYAAFADPSQEAFTYPVPPITIGSLTSMVALRKAIADGAAKPAEIEAFDRVSAQRQGAVEKAVGVCAEALIAARKDKLFLSGMWASLYKIAEAVRAAGFGGRDFHPDNMIYVGGGLKGATLPANYREFVFETFNLGPERVYQMYGMQEINSSFPRCSAGRYHAPPWVMLLLLDQGGDNLIEPATGEQEGRAAFFDISLKGRWSGVISGDRIKADYGPCSCGNRGPSIRDDITRFADLPGGDKISCSGTIDAYVRGVA